VASRKFQRPSDDEYYVDPWSPGVLQGDIFKDVPIGFASPPDAVVVDEGERRFITGPFDSGLAMLLSPSCAIAAQGRGIAPGAYAHPARALVPIRPVDELLAEGAVNEVNVGMLRADRLRNYFYLPAGKFWPESAALLYLPVTVHHDVIAGDRIAQLTGVAHRHLRVKLMLFLGGFLIHPDELGPAPEATARTS
jgi:hypothetical protein